MLLFEKVLIMSATLIFEETILQIIMIVGDGKICSLDSHHHVGRPPSSHLHVSSDIFKITGCKKYHCFERHLGTCENIPISKVVAALALPDKVHQNRFCNFLHLQNIASSFVNLNQWW